MIKHHALSAVLAGSMALSAQSAMAQGDFVSPEQARFSYAVKFVCSVENGGTSTGFLRGVYATAINVHNPQLKQPVAYFKKFVQAFVYQKAGPSVLDPERHGIDPNHAFEVECNEILSHLPPSGLPLTTGFVVFLTQDELDITAVYTAGPREVASIDVEPIAPRRLSE
jgi:hypothetical protein